MNQKNEAERNLAWAGGVMDEWVEKLWQPSWISWFWSWPSDLEKDDHADDDQDDDYQDDD